MPRKSGVTSATKDIRSKAKSNSNVKLNKSTKDDKKISKNIYIGANNAVRWNTLKNKLKYESDVELVHYLLDLADTSTESNRHQTEETPTESNVIERTTPILEDKNEESIFAVDKHVDKALHVEETSIREVASPNVSAGEEIDKQVDVKSPKRREERAQPISVVVSPTRKNSPGPEECEISQKSDESQKSDAKRSNEVETKRELTTNADSNDSAAGLASEEDVCDIDWKPGLEEDIPLRRSPRKPGPRRSARNHRHHRKHRHRRTSAASSPAAEHVQNSEQEEHDQQHVLREDNVNHKHHHEKHKGIGYRGRKKRKRKDKEIPSEKVRLVETDEPVPEPVELPPEVPVLETPSSPEPPLEKHRKKHKRRESKKRSHDIRRAPTDGIPVVEQACTTPPPALQPPKLELPSEPEPVSSSSEMSELRMNGASSVPPPQLSPIPELLPSAAPPAALELLPQRVAIRIKLCGDCGCRHVQDACPLLRPIIQVPDALTRSHWSSNPRKDGNFAQGSLPLDILSLEERDSTHGLGVVACSHIDRYTQFGPLLGDKIKEMDIPDDFNMRDIWEVSSGGERFFLSTLDNERANWLRFMRPSPTKEQRNVAVIARGKELYFVTVTTIEPGIELLFWHEHSSSGWARKKMEKTNCGGCNLRFAHSLYYRLHCSVFHDPNFSLTIRKYHCKVCGLAVLGKENIMRHAAELHAGKGAYQCQFCKKFFLRLNYLEMHRTYGCAANPQRTRPLCDFCGRKFCQPQKLKVHIKRMHSDMAEVLREFQCKMCLKLLGSRAALQRHLKEVHHKDLVGACTCDRCGKMFQNKSNLKIHMLTHSGVKPFRCTEGSCHAAFTTKQCLQFHYKKVHGFTEDTMPKIERCVAYTFDAYAGGAHEEGQINPSPPFTPGDTEESGAASPNPSLPSLEDDEEVEDEDDEEEEGLSCSPPPPPPQLLPDNSDQLDNSASSEQHPVASPTPPPGPIRSCSPSASPGVEVICSRPGILSKASKKWMGDVVVEPRMPSPVELKRWVEVVPEHESLHVKRWQPECSQPDPRMDSPDALECLPGLRSPDMMSVRRAELTFSRVVRPGEQDVSEQSRGSPIGGDFSPLRRSEPSASLLVEAALDAAERDLSGKLADLKPLGHDSPPAFLQRMNGLHTEMNEADYSLMSTCAKPPRMQETGLDMSYKQYDSDLVANSTDINSDFRVLRSPEHISFEQEQGLDMSRTSSYAASAAGYTRYTHSDLLPPHLHPHHRAAVAAAGLMYEMEPATIRSPPASPPASYQADLIRHHWHHLPATSHHTLDLSTARGQQSPEQSMSPPPPNYQNYPPSPYHAPPPRPTTPTYHHYSGYY